MPRPIELRVGDIPQLFDERDPSPLTEKDLSAGAEEFIIGWARNLPGNEFTLRIHLSRSTGIPNEPEVIEAIHAHFSREADITRLRLRRLFQIGRVSLLIGLAFLAAATALAELITARAGESTLTRLIGDSIQIGGWVAMWRPLEIFLYDWWPIRNDIRLFEGLSEAPVEIICRQDAAGTPGR